MSSRGPTSGHSAHDPLPAFSFGDGTYYVDLTDALGGRTISAAALVSQSNDGEEDDLTVGTPVVLPSALTVYDGATEVGTVAIGKGFSVTISGGGEAVYTLTFSYTFAGTPSGTDGVKVRLDVRD